LHRVFQPLTDTLFGVSASGNIEQLLVGLSVLHDHRCLPFHRQHQGSFSFLKLPKLDATTINAPYSFRLLFGAEGVRNIREYAATRNIDTLRVPPSPETLGSCFSPLFKLPDDPPPAPAMRAYRSSKSEATEPRCPSICKKREKCFSNGWQRNKRISAPG
jgi:hypothetical protein